MKQQHHNVQAWQPRRVLYGEGENATEILIEGAITRIAPWGFFAIVGVFLFLFHVSLYFLYGT